MIDWKNDIGEDEDQDDLLAAEDESGAIPLYEHFHFTADKNQALLLIQLLLQELNLQWQSISQITAITI